MYIPQDSRNNAVDINSVLSSPGAFALDSSLDAELSLHNTASESWSNPDTEALFTKGTPYPYPLPSLQSGSPTSTTTGTSTTEFCTPFATAPPPPSQPTVSSQPGIYAPTVVLQRPSIDASGGLKAEYYPEVTASSTPTATSTSPSPLHDFGNLNLNFQQRGPITIDGPVCLMNGDTVEYVDHLLSVSPEGSSCGISAPNSPMFELPSTFDSLDNITNTTNSNNEHLQMSNWENSTSLSSTPSPPPIGLDTQQQQQQQQQNNQDWQLGTNQYQQQQQPQKLATFTDLFPSVPPPAPVTSFNCNVDQTQPEQQQQPPLPTHRRSAHNAVEKKYRNNINDRIAELKNAVPALRHARVKKDGCSSFNDDSNHNTNEDDDSDEPVFMDGVAVATKLNKATILQKATEYVFHLQHANKELKQDIDALLTTIAAHVPNGQELTQKYRQHVIQRDSVQQRQLLYQEKLKRHKKSGSSSHYQYQHPHQYQHHHHSPVKGENRSSDQQNPHFIYLQQQQHQQQQQQQQQ